MVQKTEIDRKYAQYFWPHRAEAGKKTLKQERSENGKYTINEVNPREIDVEKLEAMLCVLADEGQILESNIGNLLVDPPEKLYYVCVNGSPVAYSLDKKDADTKLKLASKFSGERAPAVYDNAVDVEDYREGMGTVIHREYIGNVNLFAFLFKDLKSYFQSVPRDFINPIEEEREKTLFEQSIRALTSRPMSKAIGFMAHVIDKSTHTDTTDPRHLRAEIGKWACTHPFFAGIDQATSKSLVDDIRATDPKFLKVAEQHLDFLRTAEVPSERAMEASLSASF